MYLDAPTTTVNAGWVVDGIQIEEQWGALTTPSVWTPSSETHIDGGYIRTGEIRSNANVAVGGLTLPAWSINMSGGAQFGDASVRGSLIVGVPGSYDMDAGNSFIASGNFVAGVKGGR